MAKGDDNQLRYLDIAYELVDGSPKQDFHIRDVEQKLGLDDERARRLRRDLFNMGLLADEGGDRYRLRLPAIHQVEENRLNEGRTVEIDERREQRGSYLRELHALAEGDVHEEVDLDTLREELGMDVTTEQRTRDYLTQADFIEEADGAVRITAAGAEWVEES